MQADRRIWRGSGLGAALLEEAGDRHMREFAAALTTLQIVRAGSGEIHPLLDGAIGRLQDQVRLQQFLADVTVGEVGEAVIRLAQMVSATRAENTKLDIILGSSSLVLGGNELRLVLLACYQLLTSALGQPRDRAESIEIRVLARRLRLRMTVSCSLIGRPDVSTMSDDLHVVQRLVGTVGGRTSMGVENGSYLSRVAIPLGREKR